MREQNKTMTDSVSKTDDTEPREDVAAPTDPTDTTAEEAPVDELAVAGEEAQEAEPAVAATEAEAPAGPEAELAAIREELASLNDRYLRLAAEFTNYRRRVEQERVDTWGRAQGDVLGKLLDVLDDLQRVAGLDLGNATVEGIMEGIDLVDRKFERILGEAGVEVLDPAGEPFDPQTMEAMMRVPAESEEEDDRVAQVLQKGYTMRGQLLRPARVSVLKHG